MPLLLRPKEGVLNRERSVEDEEYHRLLIQKGGAVGASAVARSSTAQIGDEEVDQLEALFKECDINGDGVVDFEEFRRVMDLLSGQTGKKYNYLQLKAMFRLADLDNSGSIDFNEFLHAQRRVKKNWGVAKSAAIIASVTSNMNSRK